MMQKINSLPRFLAALFFLFCFVPSVLAATIDVMIVYDSTARSWVDSNGGMNTFAADAVARMNQASVNSNVDLTFRLAYTAEVSYTYSGNLATDLTNLRTGVGNLSVVDGWRDAHGADLVAMLVDTGSAYGTVGIGNLLLTYSGSPGSAFTVSAIRSVDISHTLTHEVGHNLGAHHSKYQTSSPGPNSALNTYSAGWYFTGINSTKYHTIMAYNSDGYGNTYTEAPLFSTPLLSYQGTVAGDAADGDNSRTIQQTMDVVAAYRPPAISLFPESVSFNATGGTGSIAVTTASNSFPWAATSNNSWIIVTSGAGGTGSGTITYSVSTNTTNSTRIGTITVEEMTFTVTQTAAGSLLYADFGSNGIWLYNGSTWSQLTPYNPTTMTATGSLLYGKYSNGIWLYNGSTWSQITPYNPIAMTAAGSLLYANYDNGIWLYNGSTWSQLTPYNPEAIVAAGSFLYADFGSNGIWMHNGVAWSQITPYSPTTMTATGSLLYANYSNGIWLYNGSSWSQLTPYNPEAIAAAGSLLYADFGSSGIWQYSGSSWSQLTPGNPEAIAAPQ
jgi:hypothetical protein